MGIEDSGFNRKIKTEKGGEKHLKSEPISQGLWKRENDTRNRSRFSPNRAGEKGELILRFCAFLSNSEDSVSASKIFPHNLRKLFARTFYGIEKDIAKLADILGHSSINTTRIYIMTTGVQSIASKLNDWGL